MKKHTLQLSIFTIILSIPIFAQDLNIKAGGQMYISPTAFVQVSSNLDIDSSGELIMDSVSDGFSDLFVVGTSTGLAEYRRFTASHTTRDLISSPVAGQVFSAFATTNSGIIATGTINTSNLMYGPFDTGTGTYVEYASAETTPLEAGKGYRAGTIHGETLTYKGIITTADVDLPIAHGSSAGYGYTNLVGNPFTTHVLSGSVVTALGASSTINPSFAAIYGWNGTATTNPNTWKVINSLSSEELITPGQGFMVVSNSTGTFTFPKSSRRVDAEGVGEAAQDDFIAGRQAMSTPSHFKLRLMKGSHASETSLYFIDENGSRGLDVTYDAGSLDSDIGTHLVEDSQGINMAVQVFSTDDLTATDYTIPVEVSVAAGQEATISIHDLNVPSGTKFYLDDTQQNIKTLLTSSDYTFTPSSSLSGIGRFYLGTSLDSFSSPAVALDSVEILSLTTTKKIVVQGQLYNDSVLKVYDISGRVIEIYKLEASQPKHVIDVSNIGAGVYIINLNNKNQSKTTKLVIN
jgi:hypothetical protein